MRSVPSARSSMYVVTHMCTRNTRQIRTHVFVQPSMAQGVERFFKAAIVDKNPSIASAALVSAYHLFPLAKDVVKRWVNEVQEAINAK